MLSYWNTPNSSKIIPTGQRKQIRPPYEVDKYCCDCTRQSRLQIGFGCGTCVLMAWATASIDGDKDDENDSSV